jgi:hypothetical protein
MTTDSRIFNRDDCFLVFINLISFKIEMDGEK